MAKETDILGIIESAYRYDASPSQWLKDIGGATYAHVGKALGMFGFYFDVTADGHLQIGEQLMLDMPEELGPMMRMGLEAVPPDYVRSTFARCGSDTSSQAGDPQTRKFSRQSLEPMTQMYGWRDIHVVAGMDPTNHGVYFGAWLPKETKLSPRARQTWSKVAVHLTAGLRLRRRLSEAERMIAASADAILTPGGKVSHAQHDARDSDARSTLRDAVLDIERARGRLRKSDPDAAVDTWKGLVSGRWTLVDHFESDGKRYVLARRNEVALTGLVALSARERQAVGFAAVGHNNKLIAYDMGISASTVSVLLHRAAKKLGAKTRVELVARFMAEPTSAGVGDRQPH